MDFGISKFYDRARTAMAGLVVKAFNQNTLIRALMAEDDALDPSKHVANPHEDAVYVYTAIAAITRSVSRVPVRVINKRDESTVPEDDPSWRMLDKPNALENRKDFWERTVTLRYRDGEVFWIMLDAPVGGLLPAVHIAKKSQMEPILDAGILVGWKWRPDSGAATRDLELDQVCRLYFPHPDDVLKSLSPFKAAQLAVDEHVFASRHGVAVFQHGAHLGVTLTTDKHTNREKRQELLRDLKSEWGGYLNSGKPLILWNGLKVAAPPQTLKDLDMTALKTLTREEQIAPSLVPPMYAGIYDNATFNNTRQQEQYFWDMTGIPEVEFMLECWNAFVQDKIDDGKNVEALFTEVHALKERSLEMFERALKLQQLHIPLNVIIDVLGLPFPKQPWGNVPLVNPGLIPITLVAENAQLASDAADEPEGPPDDDDAENSVTDIRDAAKALTDAVEKNNAEQRRRRIHRRWRASWKELSNSAGAQYQRFLKRQGKDILARLKKAGNPPAKSKAAADEWIKRVLFDIVVENRQLSLLSQAIFKESAELGGTQAALESEAPEDFNFSIESPAMRKRLRDQVVKVRKVNKTTSEAVRRILLRGVDEGQGLAEIAESLGDMLGKRAKHGFRIAQTEVHEAVSAGRNEGFKQVGIKKRRWLTSGLDTVRGSHRNAEVVTRHAPVDINKKFKLIDPDDGSVAHADFPGDGDLPPEERINCSCMELAAVTANGKQLDLNHYDRVRFMHWTDKNAAA